MCPLKSTPPAPERSPADKHTLWQTTQRGSPKASSHSPSLNGMLVLLLSLLVVPPLGSYAEPPLLRFCQSFIVDSMTSVVSSSSVEIIPLRNTIQSRNWRTQAQGSAQSKNITTKVSGTVLGVNFGFNNGAKAGEGSERRYMDKRARKSEFLLDPTP